MDMRLIEDGTHIGEKAQRFQGLLTAVNARIVFLAELVDVHLDAAGEVQHILDGDQPAFQQARLAAKAHGGSGGGGGGGGQGRNGHAKHRAWEELRGLIVLRSTLVAQALNTLGLRVTHQVTSQVELSLARKGIKPGADGFELLEQMERMAGALGAANGEPHNPARKPS